MNATSTGALMLPILSRELTVGVLFFGAITSRQDL